MKHDWRKHEKNMYLPEDKPEIVYVPSYKFMVAYGSGNPDDELFAEVVKALYSVSYKIKMSLKKDVILHNKEDYNVYPLEGIWDISEKVRESGVFDKDELVYKMMIRQPEHVTPNVVKEAIEKVYKRTKNEVVRQIKFEEIEEGLCVQMLHIGSYETERETFECMTYFCDDNNVERLDLTHREIYLNDFRKTGEENLRTVIRFRVQKNID